MIDEAIENGKDDMAALAPADNTHDNSFALAAKKDHGKKTTL